MNDDFKLFRMLAILKSHFYNVGIISFCTCKAIVFLVKAKAIILLEDWLYQAVIS